MAAEGPLHELGAIADRQLRLAGHGPDHGDGPAHASARARHEGVAWYAAGWPRRPGRRDATTRSTTPSASCATWPRSRSSPRSRMASPTHVGSLRPGRLADIVLWKPAWFGVEARARPEVRLSRRGRRSARATRRSSGPSRPATAPTGAGDAAAAPRLGGHVRLGRGRAAGLATRRRAAARSSRSAGRAA